MGQSHRPHVEITTRIGCPVGCRYCPQDKLLDAFRGAVPDLHIHDFYRICNNIPPEVDIHFSGMCEPFVNPYALDMVAYAAVKHSVSVFTTLTGLDIKKYDQLRRIPYRWFCVHVPDGQLNTRMKCTPEYLELLRYVVENPPKCERFWFSIHGDYHPATIPIIAGLEYENTIIDRAGNLTLPWCDVPERRNPACGCSNYDQNVVLPDGTVLLCCMDYGMKHVLGNLLGQSWDELKRDGPFDLCRRCSRAVEKEEVKENA
jgi:hypothetical protein